MRSGKTKVVFVYTLQLLLSLRMGVCVDFALYSGAAAGVRCMFGGVFLRTIPIAFSFYHFSLHICHIYRYLLFVFAAPECGGNGRVCFLFVSVCFFFFFFSAFCPTWDLQGLKGAHIIPLCCGVYWQTDEYPLARLLIGRRS
ncbi:hypothetical protein BO70DRAFT_27875 [Aspergillus heteromorphus CBS 117.55]|uniref:Uncharacterized protein n=1 Tax=Aspergillus heteromorphus CBS 117.55 TaxID=1448321 RepID=A0A317WC65_9EURO|nr:uncharacterized protein BO70DRAFT_27875 [Aspergillus heteromorphus CBS 117.55]PWY83535.1 hypothetical protein BO70DRAFT_27875 [Aspergillus heteromorphus CBS 117.55]